MFSRKNFSALLRLMTIALGLSTGTVWANTWLDLDESQDYTARHEASFVQAGNRFYLFGGRENPQTVDTYDYEHDTWTRSAPSPVPFNHFQATEYEGLIWVIGAFKDNGFPNEQPEENIYTYDPANDVWIQGREIPQERRRGSAGLVNYQGKFYVIGGNTIGHNGGYVPWFDEFDPQTGEWTPLADAPNSRDHFHATVANDKLYVAGGRLSGGPGGTFAPLIASVDVYDFATQTWTTLPSSGNLPTPRAGTSTVTFEGNVVVIGGEGNGQAFDTVEQLDPFTNLWTEISPLNHARHGTQAIVSGEGIFTLVGSPNQGGGRQRNMEAFNSSLPVGDANTPASLEFLVQNLEITSSEPVAVELQHISGTQGALITDIQIVGNNADSFGLIEQASLPNLVLPQSSKNIMIATTGDAINGDFASLLVSYDGTNSLSIPLRFESSIGSEPQAVNLALGKSAAQSSTGFGGVASRAVDGDTNGIYRDDSVTHTQSNSTQAWWEVDLGSHSSIDSVQIYNRTDCCTGRLSDFYVFVSAQPFANRSLADLLADSSIANSFHAGQPNNPQAFNFSGASGRYVRIQLQGSNPLSLAEVKVMGNVAPLPPVTPEESAAAPANQVCYFDSADYQVDGVLGTNFRACARRPRGVTNFNNARNHNNTISAISVGSGVHTIIFDGTNGQGASLCISSDTDLNDLGALDNRASSFLVGVGNCP